MKENFGGVKIKLQRGRKTYLFACLRSQSVELELLSYTIGIRDWCAERRKRKFFNLVEHTIAEEIQQLNDNLMKT